MSFCVHCGAKLPDNASFCTTCGCVVSNVYNQAQQQSNQYKPTLDDAPNLGYAFLGFLFPIVGLILYVLIKDTYPLRAKSTGKGALIGFISSIILAIIAFVLFFFVFAFRESYYLTDFYGII